MASDLIEPACWGNRTLTALIHQTSIYWTLTVCRAHARPVGRKNWRWNCFFQRAGCCGEEMAMCSQLPGCWGDTEEGVSLGEGWVSRKASQRRNHWREEWSVWPWSRQRERTGEFGLQFASSGGPSKSSKQANDMIRICTWEITIVNLLKVPFLSQYRRVDQCTWLHPIITSPCEVGSVT